MRARRARARDPHHIAAAPISRAKHSSETPEDAALRTRAKAWLATNIRAADLPSVVSSAQVAARIPIVGLTGKERRSMAGQYLRRIGGTSLGSHHVGVGMPAPALWCVRLDDLDRVRTMTNRERLEAAGLAPRRPYPPQCAPIFARRSGNVKDWRPCTPEELAQPNADDPTGNDSIDPQPAAPVAKSASVPTDGPGAGERASGLP